MDKSVDLANNPALDPEERQRQLEGKEDENKEFQVPERESYLVDQNFQFRFATIGVVSLLLFTGFVFLSVYWALGTADTMIARDRITSEFLDVLPYVAPAAAFFTLLFGVYFLLLSHRFCGPVQRLSKSLRRIARGDFYFTVSLRSTDYLQSVVDGVNDLLETLRSRDRTIDKIGRQVQELEDELDDLEDLEEQEDLLQKCESLQEHLRTLRSSDPDESGTETDSTDEE